MRYGIYGRPACPGIWRSKNPKIAVKRALATLSYLSRLKIEVCALEPMPYFATKKEFFIPNIQEIEGDLRILKHIIEDKNMTVYLTINKHSDIFNFHSEEVERAVREIDYAVTVANYLNTYVDITARQLRSDFRAKIAFKKFIDIVNEISNEKILERIIFHNSNGLRLREMRMIREEFDSYDILFRISVPAFLKFEKLTYSSKDFLEDLSTSVARLRESGITPFVTLGETPRMIKVLGKISDLDILISSDKKEYYLAYLSNALKDVIK